MLSAIHINNHQACCTSYCFCNYLQTLKAHTHTQCLSLFIII
uniref:Uncharacterized protein n=1 Tax=Anguilla anguilla TaxID=7936 RepID=A0A0E9RY69_ANGAN